MKKILIMGLPGSGKTTLATALKKQIESHQTTKEDCFCTVTWFNADEIRKKNNDWDFTYEGRIRQSVRMAQLATNESADYVIVDIVAPLVEMRGNFKADWTIWLDTISESRYDDTNKAFIPPEHYDFRIMEQNAEKWAKFICDYILDNCSSFTTIREKN